METTEGFDRAVWDQMANQLGLQALAIPEEYGGAGFGYVELTVVFEEMGAALLCAPYFATVALAANALLSSGDEAAKKDLLPGDRLGRDHRHAGAHRGQRALGHRRDHPGRHPRAVTSGSSTATRCSWSTATTPTSCSWRAGRTRA